MCLLYTPAIGGGKRETFQVGTVRQETQSDRVLLRDSFDRADSPQPGAPWAEDGEVSAEFTNQAGYHVGPARTEVSQGALSFRYVNHSQKPQSPFSSVNGRPVVYAPLARGVSARPAVFSFTFEPHPDNRIAHEAGLMSLSGGFREAVAHSGVTNYTPLDGFGISFGRSSSAFNNSQVSIIKYEGGVRTVLAERQLSFQFASGKTYTIGLTVAPDFSATVQVSDGVNTDQVSSPAPAVSFPLDQFFIADVEGGVSSDTRGAGDYSLRFDDVLVREISPTPQRRPLIFIPGIAGSRLDDRDGTKIWPPPNTLMFADPFSSVGYLKLSLDPAEFLFASPDIIAPDVMLDYDGKDVYGNILSMLTERGGYVRYEINDQPHLRTYEGCDLSQSRSDPTLFVFAYDWRKSGIESATALKEYVRCVQRFYPETDVDILAHSQGGLIARRYIITNSETHHVNKLITIATPWLGAPKAINVLHTGQFLDPSTPASGWDYIINPFVNAETRSIFKTLSAYYPSVHELVPSRTYLDTVNTPPYDYYGRLLTYDEMTAQLDQQFPASTPGLTNRAFHSRPGQDDWSQDSSGVEYHHLYGITRIAKTVGTVVQRDLINCERFFRNCSLNNIFDVVLTTGDQTVPVLSARRNDSLNAPGVSIQTGRIKGFFCTQNCETRDHLYDHTGLLMNDDVQAEVLRILQAPFQPPAANERGLETREPTAAGEPEAEPAYQVRVIGAATAAVQDSQGNNTNPMGDPPDRGLPNVTSYRLNEQSFISVIPANQSYDIIFRPGAGSMSVEVTRGTDISTTLVVRYQDLLLPAGITAKLRISPQSVETLSYDSDSDGTFETSVTPTAVVTGDAAQDHDPPVITSSRTSEGAGASVSLAATDGGTGVKQIYYSTDGANFQTYSGPVVFDSPGNHVIYAFAEDNAANRSGLSIFKVSIPQRMPPKPWR